MAVTVTGYGCGTVRLRSQHGGRVAGSGYGYGSSSARYGCGSVRAVELGIRYRSTVTALRPSRAALCYCPVLRPCCHCGRAATVLHCGRPALPGTERY